MTAYTDRFGGSTVQPSDVGFRAVALSASITTVWPSFATAANECARIMKVSASAGSLTITLPDATLAATGQDVLFDNSGAETFTVLDSAGGSVCTLTAGQVKYLYLSDNSTAAGTWRVTLFGASSSNLDASQLAGYGLKALSNTINAAPAMTSVSGDTTVVAADRAKIFLWEGGSGTLTLPTTVGSTSDFHIEVRNQGSGTVTVAPVGGVLIDGSANIELSVNESCFVHMGVTDWSTVGRGRNTAFNFTRLSKVVDGGTDTLSLTEASSVVQTYTGALLSNQVIEVPAVVQVYYISNGTTGSYTLGFKCVTGGSATVTVLQGQAAILFCDGSTVINANTSISGVTTLVFGAGSAAVPSVAIANAATGFYASGTNEIGVSLNGVYVGKFAAGGLTLDGLTASSAVATDASKKLVSVTNTGTGSNVLATSPTLVTPVLGVAAATTINKVTLTAPATGSTLTIADGKTLTASNSVTLTATDGSTLAIGTGGTLGTAAYVTLGTGVATALAVNVGSAGAPVVNGGALGTPSSGSLANCTAYPGTSALVTVGALNSGSITSGFGAIDVGADAISGGAITGTTGTFSGAVTASVTSTVNPDIFIVKNLSTTGAFSGVGIRLDAYDGTAVAGMGGLLATSANWTYNGYGAKAITLQGSNTGGLAIMATHASGTIRFYAGDDATKRAEITSTGLAVTGASSSSAVTSNLTISNPYANGSIGSGVAIDLLANSVVGGRIAAIRTANPYSVHKISIQPYDGNAGGSVETIAVNVGSVAVTGTLSATTTAAQVGVFSSSSTDSSNIRLVNTSVGGKNWAIVSAGSASGIANVGELVFYDASAGANRALITTTGLNSTVIGATTPAAGSFTTLSATGTLTLTNTAGAYGFLVKGAATDDLLRVASGSPAGTGPTIGATNAAQSANAPLSFSASSFAFNSTIRPGGYTVATLPAGTVGMKAYVTDAVAPAFLTLLVGGGAAYSGAQYSGTQWVAD